MSNDNQAIYYNETYMTQDEIIEERTEMTQESFNMLMAKNNDTDTNDPSLLEGIFKKHGCQDRELLKDVYAFYLSKPEL